MSSARRDPLTLDNPAERQAHASAVTMLERWRAIGLPVEQEPDAYLFAFNSALGRPCEPPPFVRERAAATAEAMTAIAGAVGSAIREAAAPVVKAMRAASQAFRAFSEHFVGALEAAMGGESASGEPADTLRDEAARLRDSGLTHEAVAAALGTTRGRVTRLLAGVPRHCVKCGVPIRSRARLPECAACREAAKPPKPPRRKSGPRSRDLTGLEFGSWLVLARVPPDARNLVLWWCRCRCGTEASVGSQLTHAADPKCRACHDADMRGEPRPRRCGCGAWFEGLAGEDCGACEKGPADA